MTAGTLAMPLASLGHGTKCIANAFDYIGVFCGHEVIGMSTAGSVHDLPMYLYRQLFNYDKIYSVLHTQSQPSDGRLADFYHCRWKNMRADYKNMPAGLLNEGKWVLREASERFVEAAPYNVFVEVSGLASEYWPLWKEIYDTRFIHIVIDGRKWVQKLMWYKCFTEERPTTYGVKHKPATAYEFPSMWFPSKTYSHDDNQLNRFHKCCDLWAGLHNWFAEATDVFVRVEDFNKPEAGQLVLDTLYPEATAQQVATFTLKDPNYHGGEKKKNPYTTEPYGIPHWKNWDDKYNEIFASVCGETMKRFGYY